MFCNFNNKQAESKFIMYENKVVWITGASSGIGRSLAKQFAERGAKLILSARREDELIKTQKLCEDVGLSKSDSLILPLDVTDKESIEKSVLQAMTLDGRIDVLINNAGISQRSLFLETSMETYRTLFEVDFFGQVALTKAVIPIMLKQGSGHVAVTSSVAGKIGVPLRTGYCAVKHAVMGFFDSLRTEMAPHNIDVTTITPGFIKTDISKNAIAGDGSAFGKEDTSITGGMDVEDCAKTILKGLSKGNPEIAVGEGKEMFILRLKRFFPNTTFKFMAKQLDAMTKTNQIDKPD